MFWLQLSSRFFLCRGQQSRSFFFFFNDTATTEIYTLSLHDALPISAAYQLASKVSCGTRVCSAFLAAFKASPGHQTKNVAKRLLGHLTEALRIRIALRFFHAV